MKKLFLTLTFIITLLCNVAYAKNVKFVQITDVLYGKAESADILEKAINDINEMKDIDFVVFTGDNTATANIGLLKDFTKAAKNLNKPFYVVVGDKDVSKAKHLEKEVYAKKLHRYLGSKSPKELNYTFKQGNIVFIVADGAKDFITMPNGYFNYKTMEWIENQIKQYPKNKIVILQHFPLANKTNNDLLYTSNALAYLKMINKYDNVISVVSGHFNKNDEVSLNGIYYIVTPSLTQKCYKIIEIDKDNGYQIFTSLVRMD